MIPRSINQYTQVLTEKDYAQIKLLQVQKALKPATGAQKRKMKRVEEDDADDQVAARPCAA